MGNVLFDLYGTLVDIHTDECKNSFWRAFSKYTQKYHPYKKKELKDLYLKHCALLSKDKEEIEILDVFKKLFNQDDITTKKIAVKFRQLSTKYIKLYPNVKEFLVKLKNDGHKIYLLSNAQEAFTIPELEMFDLLSYFDDYAISSMYGVKKPNEEFYNCLLKKYNMNKDKTIMIGNDYECDYLPALKLGLNAIYIHSNLTPKDQPVLKYTKLDTDLIYEDIKKILKE